MAEHKNSRRAQIKSYVLASLLLVSLLFVSYPGTTVHADQLSHRSVTLSDGTAQATNVRYDVAFTIATGGTLGSIDIQFCSNSPLTGEVCTVPNGFDASNTAVTAQSGQTGFAVSNTSTANNLLLTRPPAGSSAGDIVAYEISGVTNPTSAGPLYARILTYASSDASGPFTDDGGIALDIQSGVSVNAEVPPYLTFCLGESISAFDCSTATEPFVDLGILSANVSSAAQSQIVVATNASNGYTMSANGTTMTSGNNIIAAMTGGTSQKGTAQFGFNARANTDPSIGQDPTGPGAGALEPAYDQPNHFKFLSGDPVASAIAPEDFHKYTISYLVNVPANQPGGVYSTTLTYVCLANF